MDQAKPFGMSLYIVQPDGSYPGAVVSVVILVDRDVLEKALAQTDEPQVALRIDLNSQGAGEVIDRIGGLRSGSALRS